MIRWAYFPKSTKIPQHLRDVVSVFQNNENKISSDTQKLKSDDVLAAVRTDLQNIGYAVERSKAKEDKIRVPVLYGENGIEEFSYEVDAYSQAEKTVVEVEAGRATENNQYLKDFFECCIMQDVDYFCVAVRKVYRNHEDFEIICKYFTSLYASGRLNLPLKGILVIGY